MRDSVRRPRRRGDTPRRSTGFTLVELLVVIAIVVVIIGVTVPALRAAGKASRVTTCLNSLRSLGSAHSGYASDHRGRFADVGLPHGSLGDPDLSFVTTLRPYADTDLAFRSPLDESPHWSLESGGAGVPVPATTDGERRTSYGLNNYLSRTFSPAVAIDPAAATDRLSRLPNPASTVQFLLMADEGEFAGSDHPHVEEWWIGVGGTAFPPVVAATQVNIGAAGGAPGTGDARSNWSFADGHVGTLHFNDVYIDADTNRFDPEAATLFDSRVRPGSSAG